MVPESQALTAPSSYKISESPRKSLKRERLHKKLNDYKLDFEVMKQENSHFTLFHIFLNSTIFKLQRMEYLLLNIMNKLLVHENCLLKTD